MKALSLTQPWAWIILHLGKRIENRSRNLGNYRGTLLLHASKGMTAADYQSALTFVFQRFGRDVAERIPGVRSPLLVRGAIVGVCEVVDSFGASPAERCPSGQSWWYMGAHAYVLSDVRELTAPIPCKGALGFWTPEPDTVKAVRESLPRDLLARHGFVDVPLAFATADERRRAEAFAAPRRARAQRGRADENAGARILRRARPGRQPVNSQNEETMTEPTLIHVAPSALRKSPTNPRKQLGDLSSLIESVKVHGVIEPIIARKLDGESGDDSIEIIAGERRWTAATQAGRETVPVLLRELSDDDALDVQLAENIDRADLSPLEEAEAFQLRLDRGQTVQHVADRIGRAPSYVAQRLKLLGLHKDVRKAFDEQLLTLALALVIARLPESLQPKALEITGARDPWERPLTADKAAEEIAKTLLLRLDGDGFDTTDQKLVPKAGACSDCPKRTGQQRELFPDAASDDLCLDPVCFRAKLDAVYKLRVKAAKEAGQDVLDPKKLHQATAYHGSRTHRRLDDTEYVGGKSKKISTLFGKSGLPPLTITQDPETGRVIELVARADVERVLRANRKEQADKPGRKDGEDEFAARQRRDAEKAKLRRKAVTRIAELAVERGSTVALEDVLGLVVRTFAARVWNETQRRVLDRRGVELKGKHAEDEILKLAQSLEPGGDLEGLGLELVVHSCAPHASHGGPDGTKKTWDDLCRVLGVDLKAIEKELAAEKKAGKTTTKPAPKGKVKPGLERRVTTPERERELLAKGKRPKKSTPGTCRGCGCTDAEACDGGCEWVEPDLCSACAGEQPKGRAKRKATKPSKRDRSVES